MQLIARVATLLFSAVFAEKFTCPVLNCKTPSIDGPVTYDMCWSSDMQQPMRAMSAFSCDWYPENEKSNYELQANTICSVDLLSGEYAWVDETTQGSSAN